MNNTENIQEKILNILMKEPDLLEEFLKKKDCIDLFENQYHNIFKAISYSHSISVSLTKDSYKEYIKKETQNSKTKIIAEEQIFVKIFSLTIANKNDYPMLLENLIISSLKNKSKQIFDSFQNQKDKDYKKALQNMVGSFEDILSESFSGKYKTLTLDSYFSDWFNNLEEKKKNPQKRLLTGIKEIDESMQTGLTDGQLTLFVAEPGGMKCVPGFSVVNCDNGRQKTVSDLVDMIRNNEILPKIQSIDDDNRLFYQKISAIGYNGKKKCFRVKTSRGFSLVATGNHPVLTPKGYVNIEELSTGDRIGICRNTCFGKEDINISIATFLGSMIADGGTTGHGYRFTNYDSEIIKKTRKSVECLGGKFSSVINNGEIVFGEYHVSGCRKIGIQYNIDNVKSIHKKVPDDVFGWSKEGVSEFLKMLFSCDGSFIVRNEKYKKKSYLIRYNTASIDLAEGVRDLLLKYSIVSVLKKANGKYKGLPYIYYTVSIKDSRSIYKFINEIGFVGEKQYMANKNLENIKLIKHNPNSDIIPSEFWDIAKNICKENKVKFPRRETLKIGSGPLSSHNGRVSRDLFYLLANHIDSKSLQNIAKSDIYWDTIEIIEDFGIFDTYDISMPKNHNFICNNIITHNSCMMMNIALNVFMNYGENVLFVSLEMTKDKVMNRIIARETGIDLKKISQPELLTEAELADVSKTHSKWVDKMNKFMLVDNEERMTVGDIRRIIEKNYTHFKPKVVFIDYIAILQPDEKYMKQNEYSWAGEMCKDLRQLGRKYKFSIVSAVQLGKEALKKLKQQKQLNKTAGVEDMRGSHDYSADADNIYIQWPHMNEPTQKLCVVCAKARDGKKTFIGDALMAILEIKPNIQKIGSDNVWKIDASDPINDLMYKKYGGDIPNLDNLEKEDTKNKYKNKDIKHKNSKISDVSFLDD